MPAPSGYSLVFYDDFSDVNISDSMTYVEGVHWYTGTKPCCMTSNETPKIPALLYPSWPPGANVGFSSPFAALEPNGLAMTLQRTSGGANSPCPAPALCWLGAQISSVAPDGHGEAWQNGYVEVTLQLPPAAEGAWPSISLYTLNMAFKTLVTTGPKFEIDMFEQGWGSNGPYNTFTLHDYTAGNTPLQQIGLPTTFDGLWHTYGLLLTDDVITAYLDDQETATCIRPANAKTKFSVTITNGLGAGWPTGSMKSPYVMNVGRVSVWQDI